MVHLFRGKTQRSKEFDPGATQVLPETMWANESMPSGVPPEERVVVTITRQFGSGGAEIGRLVAQNSGLQYLDSEIVDKVAKRLGVDSEWLAHQEQQTAGMVGHILEAIRSTNPFTVNYSTLVGPPSVLTQSLELSYLHLTQEVILELATVGNVVIIGRGAQFLLHSAPRTLHTYIFAPLPIRIDNVMKRFSLDHQQAADLIQQRDYEFDTYLRHYYGSDGHQASLYHLLINTSLFPYELAAQFIQQALPVVKEIR